MIHWVKPLLVFLPTLVASGAGNAFGEHSMADPAVASATQGSDESNTKERQPHFVGGGTDTKGASAAAILEGLINTNGAVEFLSWNGQWVGMDSDSRVRLLPGRRVIFTEYGYSVTMYAGTYTVDGESRIHLELQNYRHPWPAMRIGRDTKSLWIAPDKKAGPEMGNRGGMVIPGGDKTYWPFRSIVPDHPSSRPGSSQLSPEDEKFLRDAQEPTYIGGGAVLSGVECAGVLRDSISKRGSIEFDSRGAWVGMVGNNRTLFLRADGTATYTEAAGSGTDRTDSFPGTFTISEDGTVSFSFPKSKAVWPPMLICRDRKSLCLKTKPDVTSENSKETVVVSPENDELPFRAIVTWAANSQP
jgi:hypothetical protein